MTTPSDDDREDLLLSCRYGDLADVQAFVASFGAPALADARDDNGNTILHMACANGHLDVLTYLLPLLPPTLLVAPNAAGSTPLHWAALNAHLAVAQHLVDFVPDPEPAPESKVVYGARLIDAKNAAGHTPLGEAENAGWEEGARWLVQAMMLDVEGDGDGQADEGVEGAEVEVEIEDAEGRIARMKIGGTAADEAAPADPTT